MGIRFSSLVKLVFRYGIGVNPVYWIRFLILIPTSLLSEIFTAAEKIKFSKRISKTIIHQPPVFIIGHWRSGTTFLHQLIFLDDQFTAPKVIQTVIPDHFLFSTKYWVPVLKKVMPPKRPMDEVEMGPLDPMEDEWAMIRLGTPTPFLKLFFPSSGVKFINSADDLVPSGKDLDKWRRNLPYFLKKITLQDNKQIVLKNPFHTPRITMLAEMFPGAKFIHIVRHPYRIVPSAINMWNIVAGENAFRNGWKDPDTEETASIVESFRQSVNDARSKLSAGHYAEVRYEDLEKEPVKEIRRIYSELGFSFSSGHERNILRFMEEKKNYRKNLFTLSDADKESINKVLTGYMDSYGYSKV